MGSAIWSEYFLTMLRRRQPSANSSSPLFRCRTMRVPRSGLSMVATWKSPSPLLDQCTPSLAGLPARRLYTSTCSATMNAELADQLRVLLLVAGKVLHEVGGTRLGDGAEVGDHLLATHANTVVFEGDGLGLFIEGQANLQRITAFEQLRLGQRFEAQFVG